MHVCQPIGKSFLLCDAVITNTSNWDLPSTIIQVRQPPLSKDNMLNSASLHDSKGFARFADLYSCTIKQKDRVNQRAASRKQSSALKAVSEE